MKFLVTLMFAGALCMCFAEEKIECGTKGKGNERIISGEDAEEGAWPWQVSIQLKSNNHHFCGGSIIKPDWIVTAAHCFQSNPNTADYKVIAGELNLKKKEGDEQVMDIEKIIEHPKYDESKRPKYDYDIKLLKLKTKIQFNDKVRPICLPTKRFKDGGNCYATGWGYTKDFKGNKNLKASTTLQQLKIPLVSDKTCKYAFSSMTSRMICGGYKDKGKGICKGDSGGPLACKNKSGIWDLAGAMSFVLGSCAQQNTYDFFTNIHELKGWIEDQVNKN